MGTPRSGNTWLRRVFAAALDLEEIAVHDPDELRWRALPARAALQLHWEPTANLLERVRRAELHVVSVARHPLDVLVSVLRFAKHEPDTDRWLLGAGGNEAGIRGVVPVSSDFRAYASGPRAAALLGVTPAWWGVEGVSRLHYEDILRDAQASIAPIAKLDPAYSASRLKQALGENAFDRVRSESVDRHLWRGQVGTWRLVLPGDIAHEIADAHRDVFSRLGYDCDPDPTLSFERAETNWLRLELDALHQELERTKQWLADSQADRRALRRSRNEAAWHYEELTRETERLRAVVQLHGIEREAE